MGGDNGIQTFFYFWIFFLFTRSLSKEQNHRTGQMQHAISERHIIIKFITKLHV